jgi:hypothetical protein
MSKKGRIEFVRGKPAKYFVDGREVTEAQYDAAFPSKLEELLEAGDLLPSDTRTGWPLASDALAVHPDQVQEANERNRKAGVNVTYSDGKDGHKKGQALLPSRHERRKLLRLEKAHDRDGGYGD